MPPRTQSPRKTGGKRHAAAAFARRPARIVELIAAATRLWDITGCRWVLDRTVSNSAHLRIFLLSFAQQSACRWGIDLEFSPDRVLTTSGAIVASSDSVVLDHCAAWWNAAREIIQHYVPAAQIVDLSDSERPAA